MKKVSIIFVMIFAATSLLTAGSSFGSGSGQVHAQVNEKSLRDNIIVVQGRAEIMVKPDIAAVRFGVETRNKDSRIAQDNNRKIMNTVMKALTEAGISKDDIATTNYNIYQTYHNDSPKENGKHQYVFKVSNHIIVTTTDIDSVGSIIDTATAAGVNEVAGINFDTSKREEYYHQALTGAMKNAEGKANAIVKSFGKTISAPKFVSEVSYGGAYRGGGYAENAKTVTAYNDETSIQAGDLIISATLNVEYGY